MSLAARLLSYPVLAYRYLLSPVMPGHCRYLPTCSEYALEALRVHGAGRGALYAFRRLLRCHPWSGYGYDPVPRKFGQGQNNHDCACGEVTHNASPVPMKPIDR